MIISEEEHELFHYGIKRKSGRYPWGSGEDPEQRSASFRGELARLRKEGLTDTQIAEGWGITTTQLRATISIAGNVKKQADISTAQKLKDKGMSNTAIAKQMFGDPKKESTVRGLLEPGAKDKADVLTATSNMLRNKVDKDGAFVDVGKGVANQLEMSPTRLGTAVSMLESEGYTVHKVPIPQLGTQHETTTKVLCPPGTEWKNVMQNRDKIVGVKEWTDDGGRTWNEPQFPMSLDSKRVQVKWGPEGGEMADGVIYVRPGAKDLDMGGTHYAQVRVMVDGTHYLKGMAVLKDDLPAGVDVQFNTNKDPRKISEDKGRPATKLDAMKPVQKNPDGTIDTDNPFGSSIGRQMFDSGGKLKSVVNIVNEEANWDDWSRNIASQMLSKQKPALIKSQLDVTYAKKKEQLDEILALTNPTVRERLLRSYADDMDASAVHLKAAAMPRQKTHVILPINSLKENEIYAPGYKDGETVVLIRYPHGGKFEIPELVVNNRNPEGNKYIKKESTAAVGINHKVAQRMSGADFDGDTVVVIPNNQKRISNEPPLAGLKGFDPQRAYPDFPGNRHMKNTQTEMGKISNLVTDMTIKGATHEELARAVKHSMVVIDAEKHGLDYRRSSVENGITALKKKYQASPEHPQGGASTLISRTTGDKKVPDFRLRKQSEGGPIDRTTGKLVYVDTGKVKNQRVVDRKTGEVSWVPMPVEKTVQRGSREAGVKSAFELIDGPGTTRERLYATYSDSVRSLADKARLEMVHTKPLEYSASAKKVYHKEVESLNTKLDEALKHAPLERQAQVIANSILRMKKEANPELYTDKDLLKKEQGRALRTARARTGADRRTRVEITDSEWAAIQHGAIRHTRLKEILDRAEIERVKELATPRTTAALSSAKRSRARALVNAGYTQAEIAEELGISVSTLRRGLTG